MEFYTSFESEHSTHPILKLISELPTPLFLDIDRRARSLRSDSRRHAHLVMARPRRKNIFSAFLTQSLLEASFLVEEENREISRREYRASEGLKQDLIISNFEVRVNPSKIGLRLPAPDDAISLRKMREYLPFLPQSLGIPKDRIESVLVPLVNSLDEAISNFDPKTKMTNLFNRTKSEEERDALIEKLALFNSNAPLLDRFASIISRVDEYNRKKAENRSIFNNFINEVNLLLRESKKEIRIDDDGSVCVYMSGDKTLRAITELSSGEAQIFVILSHLYFNQAAREGNVFIVDEPELSLHIQWQERFVDAVQRANSSMQFIFATHSPSIILGRVQNCRSLH